ncbi:hypothetical protein PsYK624_119230 [Phanerochaete sordida]|uniref:Uncharacterized protein n=1 Tax=Phanerochaete sordida TaxID=48140 RepID=A0A9P3GHJ4_9APHY|nr:hypothetical protein PsYK624_119230 [Phanerochaete sordida]
MQPIASLAIVAAILSTTTASPVAIEASPSLLPSVGHAHSRQPRYASPPSGYFIACTGLGFSGLCRNFPFVSSQCFDFPPAFNKSISSIVPAPHWDCILWSDPNCGMGGTVYSSVYPGEPFMNTTNFDNTASSVYCRVAIEDCDAECQGQ